MKRARSRPLSSAKEPPPRPLPAASPPARPIQPPGPYPGSIPNQISCILVRQWLCGRGPSRTYARPESAAREGPSLGNSAEQHLPAPEIYRETSPASDGRFVLVCRVPRRISRRSRRRPRPSSQAWSKWPRLTSSSSSARWRLSSCAATSTRCERKKSCDDPRACRVISSHDLVARPA